MRVKIGGRPRRLRSIVVLLLALLLALPGRAQPVFAGVNIKNRVLYPVAGTTSEYIVQLGTAPLARQLPGVAWLAAVPGIMEVPEVAAALERIDADQRDFILLARQSLDGIEFGARASVSFNGVLVRATPEAAARLAEMPGVRQVFPNGRVQAMVAERSDFIGVPLLWELTADGIPVTGEGVTVAVIDTGIDYTHPDLGGGFGPGHKVIGGYDFVNDDPDPMDDEGHGTHVAGIIAADGSLKGVAPGARLLAYKALSAEGSGTFMDIIRSLDQAILDGADIVNMSLGGAWFARPEDPPSQAVNNAVEAGLTVVVAAGNLGPYYYTVSTPGSAERAITVAAGHALNTNIDLAVVSPEALALESSLKMTGSPPAPPEGLEGEVVYAGLGGWWDYHGVDAAGKIVLVDRGQYYFSEKAQAAVANGAIALIVGNNEPGSFMGSLGEDPGIPVVGISQEEATLLNGLLSAGTVTVHLTPGSLTDRAAQFSSRGPASWLQKPDVMAPGVEILSTVPGGQYEEKSGTSMATPMVAGLAALLKQLHPEWAPEQLKSAICNTGEVLRYADGTMVDPLTQGGGRVDVRRILEATATASPTSLSFLAPTTGSGGWSGQQSVTLNNSGDRELTYSVQVAGNSDFYTVSVSDRDVTIPAGEACILQVTAVVPDVRAMMQNWLLGSGYVLLDSGTGQGDLRIPFLISPVLVTVGIGPEPVTGTGRIYACASTYLHGLDLIDEVTAVSVHDPQGAGLPVRYRGSEVYVFPDGSSALEFHLADVDVFASGLHQARIALSLKGSLIERARSFVADLDRGFEVGEDWHPVGPAGGASVFALSPAGDRIVVANAGNAAISTDAGSTWTEVRYWIGLGEGDVVTGVVIDPRDPEIVYIGTDLLYPMARGGVFKSADGGFAWYRTDFPNLGVHGLAMDPADPDRLLAAAQGNYGDPVYLFETRDGGQSWVRLEHEFEFVTFSRAEFLDHSLYALGAVVWDPGDPFGYPETVLLRRSSDASGFTVVAGEREVGAALATFGIGPSPSEIYLATADGDVHYSKDGGATWHRAAKPEPDDSMDYDSIQLILPVSSDEVYVGAKGGLYRSLDGGRTFAGITPDATQLPWLPVQTSPGDDWGVGPFGQPSAAVVKSTPGYNPGADVSAIASDAVNGYLYASLAWHGLFRSADQGATWEALRPTGTWVYEVAVSSEPAGGKFLFAGTLDDIARAYMADGTPREPAPGRGLIWRTPQLAGTTGMASVQLKQDPFSPGVLYKARWFQYGFEVLRSVDYGESWHSVLNGVGAPVIALHPTEPGLLLVVGGGDTWDGEEGLLWVSHDAGDSWMEFAIEGLVPLAIQLYPDEPDHILLGTSGGLLQTTDGGWTWEDPSPGFELPVFSIARHAPTGTLFLGTLAGLFSVSGDGSVLQPVAGSPGAPITNVKVHPDDSRLLLATVGERADWAGPLQSQGVYMSNDGGLTWQVYSEGLTNRMIFSLELDGDWAYLATVSGVWVRHIGDLVELGPALAGMPDAGLALGQMVEQASHPPFVLDPDPIGQVTVGETVQFTVTACDEEGQVREDYSGPVEITINPHLGGDARTVPDDGTGWLAGQKSFAFTPIMEDIGTVNMLRVRDPVSGQSATAEFAAVHFVDHYAATVEGSPAAGDVFLLTVEAKTADGRVEERENSPVEFWNNFIEFFEDAAGTTPAVWPKQFVQGRLELYARATLLYDWALTATVWHESLSCWRLLGKFTLEGILPGPPVELRVRCPVKEELQLLRLEVRAGEELGFLALARDHYGNDYDAGTSAEFFVLPGSGSGTVTADGVLTGTRTGTLRVAATVGDLSGVSELVIVRPGVPVSLEIVNPTAVAEVGIPYHFFARGVDALGNPVPGVDLRWALLPLSGSGWIDVSYGRLVPAQPGELVVQVFSLCGASTSLPVQVSQGALDHLVMFPEGTLRMVPRQVVHLTVQAYDAAGNCLGQPGSVAWGIDPLSTGSGTLTQNGVFQATGVGRVVVRASYNGLEVAKTIYVDPAGDATPEPPPPPPPEAPVPPEHGPGDYHAPDQVITVLSADGALRITVRPGTFNERYCLNITRLGEVSLLAAYELLFTRDGQQLAALNLPLQLAFDLAVMGVEASEWGKVQAVAWDPALKLWLPLSARQAGATLQVSLDRPAKVGLSLQAVGRKFTDISGHWAEEAIRAASALRVVDGYPDGSFGPERPVTRVELAKLVVSVLGEAPSGESPLHQDESDVPAWGWGWVSRASTIGLMVGYPDGTFRGNRSATRAEVAVILARMLELKGITRAVPGSPPVKDAAAIPGWSLDAVSFIMSEGLVRGYEDGTFRPDNEVTRAEITVMLLRFLRRVAS